MPPVVTEVKKLNGCRQIAFGDGTSLRVPEAMYWDFRVRAGDPVDRAHYEKQLAAHYEEYALDRAGRALAAHDMTEAQLRSKLLTAGYPEETVARVMEVLTRYDFVSDERYAERYVSGRSSRYGRGRILRELRFKGVSEETAKEALEDLPEEDEREAALRQARKLCARRDLADPAERRKAAAALARRGFSWDIVSGVLSEISDEETEAEEP